MLDKRQFSYKNALNKTPSLIGQAKNAFGTRLSRRLTCDRCHKVDYVSVLVRNDKTKFCRSCAEIILLKFEQGKKIVQRLANCTCKQCGINFKVSEQVLFKKSEIFCKDCHAGFQVWKGKKGEKNSKKIFLLSTGNTIIRKKLA